MLYFSLLISCAVLFKVTVMNNNVGIQKGAGRKVLHLSSKKFKPQLNVIYEALSLLRNHTLCTYAKSVAELKL